MRGRRREIERRRREIERRRREIERDGGRNDLRRENFWFWTHTSLQIGLDKKYLCNLICRCFKIFSFALDYF